MKSLKDNELEDQKIIIAKTVLIFDNTATFKSNLTVKVILGVKV